MRKVLEANSNLILFVFVRRKIASFHDECGTFLYYLVSELPHKKETA